jgi:hypothetical protein
LLLWLISFKAHSGSQGEWDIGGKVSGVKNGNEFGIKTGIKCEYHIFSILTWRSDLEAFAHSTDLSRIDISLPSNLLWYPFRPDAQIAPYAGPGITFIHTWNNRNILGTNVLAGVNFHIIRGKVFGIETKYTVPLIPRVTTGHFEIGLTGSWELDF